MIERDDWNHGDGKDRYYDDKYGDSLLAEERSQAQNLRLYHHAMADAALADAKALALDPYLTPSSKRKLVDLAMVRANTYRSMALDLPVEDAS